MTASAKIMEAISQFINSKSRECGMELAVFPNTLRQHTYGWSFLYQSRIYIETGEFEMQLVGQGPTIILNDGRVLQGGSQDADVEAVLRRFQDDL